MRIQRRRLDQGTWVVEVDEKDSVLAAAPDLEALRERRGLAIPSLVDRLNGSDAVLVAPVQPSKIVGIGLNYVRHAEEMGKPLPTAPLMFLKPSTAVIGPGVAIELPEASGEVHYEGELAVVVGRRARAVAAAEASDYILGYTIMNDVTARDIQRAEKLYTRAKGFDTFAPLGPTIVSDLHPAQLTLEVHVNSDLRQRSGCDDLIFGVPELIAFVSSVMTLLPGDVISTGTPSGVGPLLAGDVVRVSISGIGMLENPVRVASARSDVPEPRAR
jgi:2-keto-4-pentenoate hydratase/2-oxohepta-3-ene-1,7-dioic acid hydratase in catechol pathway